MTPNDIEVLLHYHCSPNPHPRLCAPAVAEAVSMFLRAEMLEPTGKGEGMYTTTEGGNLLVKALCAVPMPIRVWKLPPAQR